MKIGPNQPCTCGSGKKYKKCCDANSNLVSEHEGLGIEIINPQNVRKPFKSFTSTLQKYEGVSLYDRNQLILEAATNIFGLSVLKWNEIRRTISGKQIREFYEFIAELWHPETDFESLLPTPSTKLRALYLGDISPQLIARNVFRISLYTDEIFITDPLHNPNTMVDEYNPIIMPDSFKADTLRILLFLLELKPWITSGLVTLLPDRGNFDFDWRESAFNAASARIKNQNWKFTEEELEENSSEGNEDFNRFLNMLPREEWIRRARGIMSNVTETQLEEAYEYAQTQQKKDPLALDQTIEESGGQITSGRTGTNLETALFLSQEMGAFPFTNVSWRWRELSLLRKEQIEFTRPWSPLTRAFQELKFQFLNNIDSRFAYQMREDGRLEGFRNYLRRVWKTVEGEENPSNIDSVARDFCDELTEEYHKAESEWKEIDRNMFQWFGTTVVGGLLVGGLTFAPPALPALGVGVASAGIFKLIEARTKRKTFKVKFPMSVFVDLSKYKKRNS